MKILIHKEVAFFVMMFAFCSSIKASECATINPLARLSKAERLDFAEKRLAELERKMFVQSNLLANQSSQLFVIFLAERSQVGYLMETQARLAALEAHAAEMDKKQQIYIRR